MFIVVYQAKGRLNCEAQHFGPFDYLAAADFLVTLPPAIDCECKYISELGTDKSLALAPINYDAWRL